jgi:quinol monooxygenase YgiN
MILATVRLILPGNKQAEALSILKSAAEGCAFQADCLDCRVYKDATDENVVMFEGKWLNEEALTKYLQSDEYRKVLIVMESALEKPEIRFDTVASTAGIETVETARKLRKHGSETIN